MKREKIIMILNIILVILAMITIFLFSSENGDVSNSTSKNVTKEIIAIADKNIDSFYDNHIVIIRKIAHVTEYAILGFLLLNLFYKNITYKDILLCMLLTFLYACTDEVHQYFVDGRTARILDVFIDTIGASIGSIFYYLIYTFRRIK